MYTSGILRTRTSIPCFTALPYLGLEPLLPPPSLYLTVTLIRPGPISGVHINPVVRLGFWLACRVKDRKALPYILDQLTGGILANLVMRALFGSIRPS